MKDPNTMTLEACCFELNKPFPPLLDEVAMWMPEGWEWTLFRNAPGFGHADYTINAEASPRMSVWTQKPWTQLSINAEADTELLARARLAVACWRASKESETINPPQEAR